MIRLGKFAGVLLVIFGAIIAVIYPSLLLFTSDEVAIRVIKLTFALLALLAGAFIAAVGLAVVIGWKRLSQ